MAAPRAQPAGGRPTTEPDLGSTADLQAAGNAQTVGQVALAPLFSSDPGLMIFRGQSLGAPSAQSSFFKGATEPTEQPQWLNSKL